MKLKYLNMVAMVLSFSIIIGAPPPDAEFIVDPDVTYNGDITTDTGDIVVHSGARVKGVIESTSGDIYIEEDARVKKIISLYGDVFIETGVTVDQSITVTYGSLRVKDNSTLNGDVETESGDIRINGSYLKKGITTRHGDIILKNNTYVKGDINILDRGRSSDLEPLDIYLGTGVYIQGDISADDEDDLVELVIYGSEVNGDIDNVTMGEEEEEDNCGDRPVWTDSDSIKRMMRSNMKVKSIGLKKEQKVILQQLQEARIHGDIRFL